MTELELSVEKKKTAAWNPYIDISDKQERTVQFDFVSVGIDNINRISSINLYNVEKSNMYPLTVDPSFYAGANVVFAKGTQVTVGTGTGLTCYVAFNDNGFYLYGYAGRDDFLRGSLNTILTIYYQ